LYSLVCIMFCVALTNAGAGWLQVPTANGQFPPYDSLRPVVYGNKVYSFGGFTENQNASIPNVWSNDVWVFDGFTWSILPTTGTRPSARGYEVTFIRGHSLYVVFGGSYTSAFGSIVQTNEMTALDLTTNVWSAVTYANTAPSGLFAPAGWYVDYKDALYIFGGINFLAFSAKQATYRFDFATSLWNTLSFTGAIPTARYDVSMSYFFGKAYIYAGETLQFTATGVNFIIPADVQWTFDTYHETWTQEHPAVTPTPARNNGNGMSVDVLGGLVMYGGDIGGGPICPAWFQQNSVQETWVYYPLLSNWAQMSTSNLPPPLKRAGTVTLGLAVYLFGGFYFTGCTVNRNQNTYVLAQFV